MGSGVLGGGDARVASAERSVSLFYVSGEISLSPMMMVVVLIGVSESEPAGVRAAVIIVVCYAVDDAAVAAAAIADSAFVPNLETRCDSGTG